MIYVVNSRLPSIQRLGVAGLIFEHLGKHRAIARGGLERPQNAFAASRLSEYVKFSSLKNSVPNVAFQTAAFRFSVLSSQNLRRFYLTS